ncbi:GNAT family N-acetyltransferase [Actinospica durhamensis]|uniref:GNAT family N-acetyltransferase n=1 Tax=Actinospica durhamensis TaxID=1508375 RepID=A0A941EWD2_9ACTN|nr:GNAT family protein [Actinospica durhamensis]MBR7837577.1 GNAT family N-acetyltransferase [Actinospica durhamensis]
MALEPLHLTAGRFYLRPPEAADHDALGAALSDPGIVRWNTGLAMAAAPAAERAGMWLRLRAQNWANGTGAYFVVLDAVTGALLGTVGIRDIDRVPQQALASYWTVPSARGRGVAAAALETVSGWAESPVELGGLGLIRLSLDHALANSASCRVAEKAGYALEGVMRASFLDPGGERHDSHLHARIAPGH